MHKDKTAFTYYLLTDIAFARHLTQLSKCLTEQMGLIRLPQGMSTLTMPRGVNAPIWHLCAFPQQKIHHQFAWLQMDPFLYQRTEHKWFALFPVCFIFGFYSKHYPNKSRLHPVIVSFSHLLELAHTNLVYLWHQGNRVLLLGKTQSVNFITWLTQILMPSYKS